MLLAVYSGCCANDAATLSPICELALCTLADVLASLPLRILWQHLMAV